MGVARHRSVPAPRAPWSAHRPAGLADCAHRALVPALPTTVAHGATTSCRHRTRRIQAAGAAPPCAHSAALPGAVRRNQWQHHAGAVPGSRAAQDLARGARPDRSAAAPAGPSGNRRGPARLAGTAKRAGGLCQPGPQPGGRHSGTGTGAGSPRNPESAAPGAGRAAGAPGGAGAAAAGQQRRARAPAGPGAGAVAAPAGRAGQHLRAPAGQLQLPPVLCHRRPVGHPHAAAGAAAHGV